MPKKSIKKARKRLAKSTRSALGRASQATLVKAIAAKSSRPSLLRTGGYSFKAQGGQELNFSDTFVQIGPSAPAIHGVGDTLGYLECLNGTTVGAANNQRIGRRIDMKSIQWLIEVSNMDAAINNTVRYCIVVDSQANGALPLMTDIYNTASPLALRNISNKARFRVLADSGPISVTGNDSITATAGQLAGNGTNPIVTTTQTFGNVNPKTSFVDKGYKKIGINTQYNSGGAGTIADIQTNSLLFIFMCDAPQASKDTLSVVVAANLRVRYLP